MVASITNSVAGLVSFGSTVTGVLASYDLKTFYDAIGLGSDVYPCLLAVPELGEQSGWQSMAFMGQGSHIEFILEHYLLFNKVKDSADITVIMPNMTTLIDAYIVALGLKPFLTDPSTPSTHTKPQVNYRPAVKTLWNQTQYHSMVFRLHLGLNL